MQPDRALDLRQLYDTKRQLPSLDFRLNSVVRYVTSVLFNFFLIFEGHKSFCGATDIPLLVSKSQWAALFAVGRGICFTCSLRFTGVRLADLLVASMAAELFSSTYLQVGIGEA